MERLDDLRIHKSGALAVLTRETIETTKMSWNIMLLSSTGMNKSSCFAADAGYFSTNQSRAIATRTVSAVLAPHILSFGMLCRACMCPAFALTLELLILPLHLGQEACPCALMFCSSPLTTLTEILGSLKSVC